MTQKTAAWRDGFNGHNADVKVGDNPFKDDCDLYWEWMRGWLSAALSKYQLTIKFTGPMGLRRKLMDKKQDAAAPTGTSETTGSVTLDYAINLLSEIGSDNDFANYRQAKIDADTLVSIKTRWNFK